MPREKQYSSRAEQQAAYRERKRQELGPEISPAEADEVAATLVELEPIPSRPSTRALPISEDDYVKLMLSEPHILDRKRAESYARWRYNGVREGRVASL